MTRSPFEPRSVGLPLRRKEDDRLVIGMGQFSDDFSLPDQAYAVMVRSLRPHARIVSYDLEAARAAPGVLGIFTGEDCAADGLGPIPHNPLPKTRYDLKLTGAGGSDVIGRACNSHSAPSSSNVHSTSTGKP